MRKVAIILALLCAVPLLPTGSAADDCTTDIAEGRFCTAIPVDDPGTPPGLPGAPPQAGMYYGTYYLWIGGDRCMPSPISNACRGVPASPGSGVPTPAGPVGTGLFGVVYEESNSVGGLQRGSFAYNGALRPADHMVLA